MRRLIITSLIAAVGLVTQAAPPDRPFFDTGAAPKLIEPSVHLTGGGSTVFHNYKSAFREIESINTNMGFLGGIGARATFGIRGFLGLTTELNFQVRNYNIDMSVVGSQESTMSAVFINSRQWQVSIPVLITLRFNVAHSVVWNVDFGPYYSYGIGGHQKQSIFVGKINSLGQLVGEQISIKSPYYNSEATFQNSFRRSDWGVHLGTSLSLGPHMMVGARIQAGLKNTSYTRGLVNPRVRNFDVAGMVGWRF